MASGERAHVLLVDDVWDQVDTLALVFELAGFVTSKAYDAAGALAIAQARPPAVVVLDLVLPEMDGFLLAQAFRAERQWRDVALVAYTGDGSKATRERCAAAGIDVYVLKPFDPVQLVETIRKALRLGHVDGRFCVRGVIE